MTRVTDAPVATLCCELSPEVTCNFCKQNVCSSCWASGRHWIKTLTGERSAPDCVDPWKVKLKKLMTVV